jgi:poly-gamma-glutamate synthesis protein (capsule biosynthesis protein)
MNGKTLITIFLCGDVMLGRGIDQVLPHPGNPTLYEPGVRHASTYVELAERKNGPIAVPVEWQYIWGDALALLRQIAPDVRVINLETSVTTNRDHWPRKPVLYRMNPANVPCLAAARIDCCVLANNHVLDWGYPGLEETLQTLRRAGIKTAGAGRNDTQAEAPAVLDAPGKGRVLVFAFGLPTSGVPVKWAAGPDKAGVNVLSDLSGAAVQQVAAAIARHVRDRDIVIASLHWGGNWGYRISEQQVAFAHRLIDRAGVDIVHGHSSHHVKGLEVYHDRLILYGCGDFVNDYEGIGGKEEYRPDLSLMYVPMVEAATGALSGLRLVPMQVRRFRLNRASRDDALWLRDLLARESQTFGVRVRLENDGLLDVEWEGSRR